MKRLSLIATLAFAGSCVVPPAPTGYDKRDVRGNYALTWDDQLKFSLYLGGATREATATGYGNVVDFGSWQGQPLKLDLTAWCARPDVQCPSEVFWKKVAIDQPDLKASGITLQKLVVIDNSVSELDAGVHAAAVAGLVNAADQNRFIVGLGAVGGANQSCILLGASLAGGRFSHEGEKVQTFTEYRTFRGASCDKDAGVLDAGTDAGANPDGGPICGPVELQRLVIPDGAAVSGIVEGRIVEGWAGGCAFGPAVVGAVLTIESGFTGKRTGKYDPPPFTPVEVTLPDGGFDAGFVDAGSASDGGEIDGG